MDMTGTDSGKREMSDDRLVVAVGRWNPAALREVYRRHGGAVWALARRVLGDDARAEDVTQEVFLDLWNNPDRFDAKRGSLRTYLLTKTHSRAVDTIRTEAARRRREEADLAAFEFSVDDLEREVIDLATVEEMRQALDALPSNERVALQLTYFQGHTYREAAELLGEPEGTMKSRIRKALKNLRHSMPSPVEEA